jgi:hypothetical protein
VAGVSLLITRHLPLLSPLAGYTADRELEVRRYIQPQFLTLPRRFSYDSNLPPRAGLLKARAVF